MADAASPRPVAQLAAELGVDEDRLVPLGHHRGRLLVGDDPADRSPAAISVLVTAMSPTAAGEGKTVTAIGLGMGLARLGRQAVVTLRQSSLGPTLGAKGGGVGGGAARVEPFVDAMIGLGGDQFAVESAHNLLASRLDDALLWDLVDLDPDSVAWPRVVDLNDRALRRVRVGLAKGAAPRDTAFTALAASEVMAIVALARDRSDLRRRVAEVVVGWSSEGHPVTAADLGVDGAMAVLLREAVHPHLLQTCEGTPVLIHAGPFANVGPGVSSVIADRFALGHADVVVTEAGFAAELGAEKYLHLKRPLVGADPAVVVLVASVRAIREHGERLGAAAGVDALGAGMVNLERHLRNLDRFGARVVVAVNRFGDETDDEIAAIDAAASAAGATATVAHAAYARGGRGTEELAAAVLAASVEPVPITPLYADDDVFEHKVGVLAAELYGAGAIAWSDRAQASLERMVDAGFGHLPPCVAKTPRSLSHDPELAGAPTGFTFPVDDIELAAGAGYLRVLSGRILLMPGLPREPRALGLDLDEQGRPVGLV